MSVINFDATQVAPQQPIEAIPAGWYKAAVTESELVPTSDGSGMRLKYELTILEGPFKNRKVFDGFNLQNSNPQAVEIAQQQLSALCHATGVLRVQDSSQLHNIPVGVKVSLDPERTADASNSTTNPTTKQPYKNGDAGTKTYDAQNRVKAFKNVNDVTTDASTATAASTAPTPSWAEAKPGPAVSTPPPAASKPSDVPPWETGKPAATPPPVESKPSTTSALPTSSPAVKGPKGPKKKPAAEAPKPERKFYVYLADNNMPLKTESEIAADFVKGMPTDTPLLLEADIESNDWKDAVQYKIAVNVPATVAPAANGNGKPPWER